MTQIVNRTAKSYNRVAVEMRQQLANKSRQMADQATDARKAKESVAIEAAKETRIAEHQLEECNWNCKTPSGPRFSPRSRSRGLQKPTANVPTEEKEKYETDLEDLQSQTDKAEAVASAALRQAERPVVGSATQAGSRNRAAPSLGRGPAIRGPAARGTVPPRSGRRPRRPRHLRRRRSRIGRPGGAGIGVGDRRGADSPARADQGDQRHPHNDQPDRLRRSARSTSAVHTVQINGEHGDRMEVVADRIQKYIDHSRFLTSQSAEMLRKAIVKVAAIKATECGQLPGLTQEQRDRKYLYEFFGADFIHELAAMDSEFLRSGNKLLSLHSMDSTSLASALFMMALAKNSTRMAILEEFHASLQGSLPAMEQNYFEAGLTAC